MTDKTIEEHSTFFLIIQSLTATYPRWGISSQRTSKSIKNSLVHFSADKYTKLFPMIQTTVLAVSEPEAEKLS